MRRWRQQIRNQVILGVMNLLVNIFKNENMKLKP